MYSACLFPNSSSVGWTETVFAYPLLSCSLHSFIIHSHLITKKW
jgi:hypothetical protein